MRTKLGLLFAIFVCIGFVNLSQASDLSGSYFVRFETGFATANGPDFQALDLVKADLGNTMYFGFGGGYQVFQKLRADLTITYRGGWNNLSNSQTRLTERAISHQPRQC